MKFRKINGMGYEEVLERINALMDLDPDPASPEGRELEELAEAVVQYEDEEYRFE